MQDLTSGPITRHLLKTTSFMLVTMVFQTLYFLIDLYWVGRLGTQAVAAVAIAGNWTFIVLALSQMLGVGATAVISHAFGRKDRDQAALLFNQSQLLAVVTGVVFLAVGLAVARPYADAMSNEAETSRLAASYLSWFVPAMALQFPLATMASALRAGGNFRTPMIISTVSVTLNMLLAPVLIFGWGTGRAFGVAGAALSSLIAILVAIAWLLGYFARQEPVLRFHLASWTPRYDLWKKMLGIGLPAGFEFAIIALSLVVVYSVLRPFGSAAQAAYGIGMRLMQAGFMAVVALGFAVAPVAGQNFGARIAERVRETFRHAAMMAAGYQLLFGLFCLALAPALIGGFTDDAATIAIGATYLRIATVSFVPSGLVFVMSSMFQAMGNTMPALISSGLRFAAFVTVLFVIAPLAGFRLEWVWWLAVTAGWFQLVLASWLLRREFRRRLSFAPTAVGATAAPSPAAPLAGVAAPVE